MTTKVHLELSEPTAKIVVEVWQTNHVMGENKRIRSHTITAQELGSFSVWHEQYLIIREARVGEQI